MIELPRDGFSPETRTYITVPLFARPINLPRVPEGQALICEYIRAQGMPELTRYFRVDTLEDMQHLYDGYAMGGATEIKWFLCDGGTLVLTHFETEGSKQD